VLARAIPAASSNRRRATPPTHWVQTHLCKLSQVALAEPLKPLEHSCGVVSHNLVGRIGGVELQEVQGKG
jgi:hypothetical protein